MLLACWAITVSLEFLQPSFSKFLLIHTCGMDTKVKPGGKEKKGTEENLRMWKLIIKDRDCN
jgi:hypothetical protein